MGALRFVLVTLLNAAKESPAVVLFLATLGLLAFMLYGALFVAEHAIGVLLIYVFLAICILVVLLVLLFLNRQKI